MYFCTAYDEHALDAFKSHAEGYLLKPVMQQELQQVLDHLDKTDSSTNEQLKTKKEDMDELNTNNAIKLLRKPIVAWNWLPVENIYYFLADQNMSRYA